MRESARSKNVDSKEDEREALPGKAFSGTALWKT